MTGRANLDYIESSRDRIRAFRRSADAASRGSSARGSVRHAAGCKRHGGRVFRVRGNGLHLIFRRGQSESDDLS